jgi:hypothetical protein
MTRHGLGKHPLRIVYTNMMRRCYMPDCRTFKDYGGRGIKVCEQWAKDRAVFFAWALPLWSPGLTIDRIDNNGDYSPDNCRFVTQKENCRNKRNSVITEQKGKDVISRYQMGIPIARIARELSISRPSIYVLLHSEGVFVK